MNDTVRKIDHPAQLNSLARWRATPSHRRERVRLDAPGASPEQVQAWEVQLTRLKSPCGCDQGAFGLVAGAIGYVLFLLLRPGGWGEPGWPEVWLGIAVVLVTTSAGKFIGIAVDRRKLQRVIQDIRAKWKPERPPARGFGTESETAITPARRCCGN